MKRLLLALPFALPAFSEDPWSVDPRHPVLSAPPPQPPPVPLAARPLTALVRFYQKRVSPHDGPRCLLTPTCSEYSRRALAKHGALLGSFLTADRLMQEHDAAAHAPLVFVHGRPRGWDPVEANDFWWARGPLPVPPRGAAARSFPRGFQIPGRMDEDQAADYRASVLIGRKRRTP